MTEKIPVALSMGVVSDWLPEGIYERLDATLKLAEQVTASAEYGPCGIELMCRTPVDVQRLQEIDEPTMLRLLNLSSQGGTISLHAPPGIYGNGWSEQQSILYGIALLSDKLPLSHVVFHAGWFLENEHAVVKDWNLPVALENDDAHAERGHRSVDQLSHLSELAKIVVDVAHVAHFYGAGTSDSLQKIVRAIDGRIAAYHFSSIDQETAWHKPMANTSMTKLLSSARLTDDLRVLETPVSYNQALRELVGELSIATANCQSPGIM
jgi:sugar phosphate isomerase/epimerase